MGTQQEKTLDVTAICNALVDVVVEASQEDLDRFELKKGIMHLVDEHRQKSILSQLDVKPEAIELGGSSLNAIRTLAGLGFQTSFMGMTGDDDFGGKIRTRLSEHGIKAHLGQTETATGSCLILVTPDGERTMNTCLGASCLFDESIVQEQDIASARVFHFCGYQWANPGQISAIRKAIDLAAKAGTKVSFDLADPFVVGGNRDDFTKLIEDGHTDVIFANREEMRLLVDYDDPERAARETATRGKAVTVVKLGAEGAVVADPDGKLTKIDVVPADVKDTTAAGDMFASGFLAGMCQGLALQDCGRLASHLASDVISRYGATVSQQAIEHARSSIMKS